MLAGLGEMQARGAVGTSFLSAGGWEKPKTSSYWYGFYFKKSNDAAHMGGYIVGKPLPMNLQSQQGKETRMLPWH